jgi:2-dehydropantoate 2-reductase
MDASKYKIGVIGLGPVGLTLAAHFKEAGCDVHICDVEKKKINLIRNSGIELVGKIEKLFYFNHVYSSIDDMLNNDIDILVSAVKAYHVDSIMEQNQNGRMKNMLLLIAQNGIEVRQKYSSVFDDSRILRMVINYAGNMNAPNVVNVTFFNPPNYIASIDDSKTEAAEWLSEVLTTVNLETKTLDSFRIEDKIWEKTILNAALSPLCAISKLTMKEAMAHPDTLVIIEQLILEAIEVAKAEDIKFCDNFVKICIRYLKNAGDHFPSLAVDLLNGRETEIDYMNGKIVEFGKKHYIRTPLNLTFTNLVKAISHKNNSKQEEKYNKDLITEGV